MTEQNLARVTWLRQEFPPRPQQLFRSQKKAPLSSGPWRVGDGTEGGRRDLQHKYQRDSGVKGRRPV